MNKSQVRCWLIPNWSGKGKCDEIYISYPEDNSGHDLISCLRCGHIYAVSIIKKVYVGPNLEQKLDGLCCVECGEDLRKTYALYPEQYMSNGEIVNFKRPNEIPPDSNSVVMEFDEIY